MEHPLGLLFAADDFDRLTTGGADGSQQFICVHCVASGTGGDDAQCRRALLAGCLREVSNGPGGVRDGVGAEAVIVVEAPAQAGLLAAFPDWLDGGGGNIRDEQLHGVGADVYDGATLRGVISN